jgi:hypothetical protein
VKSKFKLWVTPPEKAAMTRVLATCPGQDAPTGGNPTTAPVAGSSPAARATTAPEPHAGTDPRFATCKAAKAAGYGPYKQGFDAEYGWYRDADHDGLVCE